jgi:hypothetical protein
MSSIKETAAAFFDACESGQGWDACAQYCHPDATFSAQADTFGDLKSLQEYTEAMKGLLAGPLPGATYELRSFAVDDERRNVCGFAVFKGAHTGEGGPVPPSAHDEDLERRLRDAPARVGLIGPRNGVTPPGGVRPALPSGTAR